MDIVFNFAGLGLALGFAMFAWLPKMRKDNLLLRVPVLILLGALLLGLAFSAISAEPIYEGPGTLHVCDGIAAWGDTTVHLPGLFTIPVPHQVLTFTAVSSRPQSLKLGETLLRKGKTWITAAAHYAPVGLSEYSVQGLPFTRAAFARTSRYLHRVRDDQPILILDWSSLQDFARREPDLIRRAVDIWSATHKPIWIAHGLSAEKYAHVRKWIRDRDLGRLLYADLRYPNNSDRPAFAFCKGYLPYNPITLVADQQRVQRAWQTHAEERLTWLTTDEFIPQTNPTLDSNNEAAH
jgi:hypothetical protein